MAVDWLDIARYADSYGFQVDRRAMSGRGATGSSRRSTQSALRSIHHLAARWRFTPPRDRRADPRYGVQPAAPAGVGGRQRRRGISRRVRLRPRANISTAFLGLTFECCPLSRSQVRSDRPEGILSVLRDVPEHRRSGPVFRTSPRNTRRPRLPCRRQAAHCRIARPKSYAEGAESAEAPRGPRRRRSRHGSPRGRETT